MQEKSSVTRRKGVFQVPQEMRKVEVDVSEGGRGVQWMETWAGVYPKK